MVLGSPFIGQIRGAIASTFPDRFRLIVGGAMGIAAALVVVSAVIRIRERRALRYALLAASIAVSVVYARLVSTGSPDVDVVERVHFVEYGLLTFLFYRARRRADSASAIVVPAVATMIVGTFDEWFQWFVPGRVGELHDVWLNGVAVACGVLVGLALDPPAHLTLVVRARSSRRLVAVVLVSFVMALASFVQSVHLGYELRDDDLGTFLSTYSRDELAASSAARSERWHDRPLLRMGRLSREDQYFSEGVWHVQRRNLAWEGGAALAALCEDRILERYFAPVIVYPSYVSATGFRWPPEHKAVVTTRAANADPSTCRSVANPYPIYTHRAETLWGSVSALVIAIVVWARVTS